MEPFTREEDGLKLASQYMKTNTCSSTRSHLFFQGTPSSNYAQNFFGKDLCATVACDCARNLCYAMIDRGNFGNREKPTIVPKPLLSRYRRHVRAIMREISEGVLGKRPTPECDIPATFSGPKRVQYQRAYDAKTAGYDGPIASQANVKNEASDPIDSAKHARARVTVMPIKKTPIGHLVIPNLVEIPVARFIQVGQHHMINKRSGEEMMAGGHNPKKRAAIIIKAMSARHGKVVCLMLDVASFDGSQGSLATIVREATITFAQQQGISSTELVRLLKQQERMPLFSMNGYRGIMVKNRQSGTGSTSCANKIVMMAALRTALQPWLRDIEFYCDGDDTLVFLYGNLAERVTSTSTDEPGRQVRRCLDTLTQMGLPTKLDGVAMCVEDITFCRAQIVHDSVEYTLCKKPDAAVSNILNVRRHFKSTADGNIQLKRYLTTYSKGIQILWDGIPLMSSLHYLLPQYEGMVVPTMLDGSSSGIEYLIQQVGTTALKAPFTPREITPFARQVYATTTGISIDRQLNFEAAMRAGHAAQRAAVDNFRYTPGPLPPR